MPRSFSLGLRKSNLPPPPTVEDEAESLAREHGGFLDSEALEEEPKFRGDLEQQPILLPVAAFNPERRFVLVSDEPGQREVGASATSTPTPSIHTRDDIKPSAGGRNIRVEVDGGAPVKTSASKPRIGKRKSHQDLPQINTAIVEPPSSPTDMSRSKSATHDRRSHTESSGEALLSPVIKHSTKGRDRAYWDFSAGANAATVRNRLASDDPRAPPPEKRKEDGSHRTSQSLDTLHHRRSHSTIDRPGLERSLPERYRYREGASPRVSSKGSPPRSDHVSPSPQSARRPAARRTASYRGSRAYLPPESDEYIGDSYVKNRTLDRHRDSSLSRNGRDGLLSPDRPTSSRADGSKSRGSTPLASPRVSQTQFSRPMISRNKSTWGDDERYISLHSRPRPKSNAESPSSSSYFSMPVPSPIATSFGDVGPRETRSPLASPTVWRHDSQEASPALEQQSAAVVEYAEPKAKSVKSYRQYLEDVQRGVAPAFVECRRGLPVAGYVDWLTVPRAINLDICPDCYEAEFGQTTFRHSFVPSPLRSLDQPVACDFTASPWFRIAWLMTLKYGFQDLHLLQSLASVTAKCQPCSGSRISTRVWYSILDPYNRRPIPDFAVCYTCAKAVEVILPNMAGVFVPVEISGAPTPGVCAMRFKPDRKRFVELFDLFETTSDRALLQGAPPSFQSLANKVRDLSLVPECVRDEPVRDAKWFVMETVPDLTVCEECFDQVVWPIIELGDKGGIARNFFHRPQRRPLAACQLYSDRMREVFAKACRRNDMQYLDDKVRERQDIERALKAKLAEHPTDEERRELIRKWEEWE